MTAAVNPPAASILRGVIVPPYGGDTIWTNLAEAYKTLSAALRRAPEGQTATADFIEKDSDGRSSASIRWFG